MKQEPNIIPGLNVQDWLSFGQRYGDPPHGGIGLGVERLTMQLLGIDNIREVTLLPRDRLTP